MTEKEGEIEISKKGETKHFGINRDY